MNTIEGKVIKLNKSGEMGYKKDCLNVVGKLISDKEINFKTCKNALLGMWGNPQGVAVTDIGRKKILFSFKDRKKGLQIIQNGPWNVKGNMINLRLWKEGESVFEVDHDFMKFWIQVHGIPLEFMEKETARLIGEMLGVLVEAEEPKTDGVLKKPYLRIREPGERESSDERSFEESRMRSERVSQQKIREESVWENQMKREEEMADAEEQVEEVPRIPNFQEEGDTHHDLEAAYKISNLIEEIRERKNEWANFKKAQMQERRNQEKKSDGIGQARDIGPNTGASHQQVRIAGKSGLNKYAMEREEVNSYKIEDWRMGPGKKGKETIGQELKRLMLARKLDKQECVARTEEKEKQELLKGETEENANGRLSKEDQMTEHKGEYQKTKPGDNIYYVELASDEDEEKEAEAQTDWEMRLAKKLELNLNLKRK
ncbi:hypothetical protein Ahy_A08g040637 [Arachis hypogaea]|uniref:DUF4283 domain-containing protein n=1 Tax=Arachis hypogaea TaxID=3818 RepID=A0A445BZW3_ARAHY|nr:hypothetical protein Ahy_A08g040637 [Arachis hypogaea]